MPNEEPMIRVQDVKFRYDPEQPAYAVDGVSLCVYEGEFLSVLGHNGSGKSTLAKLMNALYRPSAGTVCVGGVCATDDEHAYAVEISGDSMIPLYRPGDILIVSPDAPVRKGDRVVVKTTSGEVTAKILAKRTGRKIELHSINPAFPPRVLDAGEVEWIGRVIWAKQ